MFNKMIDLEEEIEFTDVETIFTKAEIKKMLKYAKVKPHQCHINSYRVAELLNCGVCEGVIMGLLPHAFNYIILNGKKVYFDITEYNNKRKKILTNTVKEAVVLRIYPNSSEILRKYAEKGYFHLTIERDYRLRDYLTKIAV